MDINKPAIQPVEYGRYIINNDDESRVIEVLEGFTEISGYTMEDIKARNLTLFDFLPETDRQAYIDHIQKIFRGEAGSFLQHRFVKKDGSVIMVLCFGDIFTDSQGRSCSKITICNVSEMVDAKEKYAGNLAELEAVSENIPGGLAVYEIVGDELIILKANDEYYRMFGYNSPEEHPGKGGQSFRREEVIDLIADAATYLHSGKVNEKDILFTKTDGTPLWMKIRAKFLGQSANGNYMMCVIFIDISAAKKAEKSIVNQQEKLRIIAENTEEIYFDYDVEQDIMEFSNCISRYVYEDNRVPNYFGDENYKLFTHPEDQALIEERLHKASLKPQRGTFQFRTKAFDDDYIWYKAPYVSVTDDTGKVTSIFGKLYNIENVQKLKNRIVRDKLEIERLSTTDQVTGLLIRKAFIEKVSAKLSEEFDIRCCYCIIYSDINDFSYVNDNFGFDSGNQMLHDFATDLIGADICIYACRIYSDFFAVFAKGASRDEIIESVKKINQHFNNDQKLKYPASDLHISSGVYFLSDPDIDVTIAIDNADLARRSVKGVKEIHCGIYSERMRKQRSHEQQIAAELKNALQSGQIELFLQPKFSLDTREIIGAEALSRWRNPDGSYKLPYEFISVLEKVGYIVDLDMYIYESLLKTMSRWKREGYKLFPVSINFSRNHASHRNFVDRLSALSDFYKIDPKLIEIEITESSFMQDFNALYNDMKKLRERGFKIDIDDFGMGYSSLSVLLNAPVDIVKVDKVFIDNIASNPQARDYVNQICSLINLTNKAIVFEGVETEDQAKILASSGHKMAQGWLFDKAISVAEFERKYLVKK